jgi:hypothetical protein
LASSVDQGLCLDGLEKKKACDEKKQEKNAFLQNDLLAHPPSLPNAWAAE